MTPALEYIHNTPEPYQSIMIELDALIQSTIPQAQLLYKWKLPFYYLGGKKMFVFLNYRNTYVDLAFIHGVELQHITPLLINGENRKTLRSLRFKELHELDVKLVTRLLIAQYELRK